MQPVPVASPVAAGSRHGVDDLRREVAVVRHQGTRQLRVLLERSRNPLARSQCAAKTVHRSQGATVDTAHYLEDGGGRELAYVALSRARQGASVYVEADDLDQAAEDLSINWTNERRQEWVIDQHRALPAPSRGLDDGIGIGL